MIILDRHGRFKKSPFIYMQSMTLLLRAERNHRLCPIYLCRQLEKRSWFFWRKVQSLLLTVNYKARMHEICA